MNDAQAFEVVQALKSNLEFSPHLQDLTLDQFHRLQYALECWVLDGHATLVQVAE